MIKIFWNDSELNIGVASSEAIEAPLNSVLDKFYDLSEAENSFLGLKKSDNDIIQFTYLREDIWLVDIPVIAERGSYMKECEYQDCVDIIRSYYTDSWKIPSQFTLRKW